MGETVEALVEAGRANAGPPLGPALGPSGVNVKGQNPPSEQLHKAAQGLAQHVLALPVGQRRNTKQQLCKCDTRQV